MNYSDLGYCIHLLGFSASWMLVLLNLEADFYFCIFGHALVSRLKKCFMYYFYYCFIVQRSRCKEKEIIQIILEVSLKPLWSHKHLKKKDNLYYTHLQV